MKSLRPLPWPVLAPALLVAAAAVASLTVLPSAGLDFIWIKRLNLVILVAAAALVALGGVPGRGEGWRSPRGVAILCLATLAALGYLNFFSFHGERTWIHLHDVAHYYLGGKYYAELGYRDLYTAMLRAEAETHDNHFRALQARDLGTYRQVHIRELLARSDAVRAAFDDRRWEEFKKDVEFFRSRLGPNYAALLLDHGFNPTPVWALIGGFLAGLVPAGSHAGILALTLIDPLLILAGLALTWWAFGGWAAALALLHYCVIFGATFGWTGGAFMRLPWLFGLLACLCLLRKGRHGLAGAALALSASLRIFPIFFALPLLMKALSRVAERIGRRGLRRPRDLLPRARYLRFAAGLAAGLALLAAATLLPPGGLEDWKAFRHNLGTHVETISPNMVGLTDLLAFRPGAGKVTQEEFQELKARRQRIHAAQILLAFLPGVALAFFAASRFTDWAAPALLAPALLYLGVSLASYYYVFLVALVLVHRARPRVLSAVFLAEAVPYAAMPFVHGENLLYLIRGLALVPLFAWFILPPAIDRWRRLAGGAAPAGGEAA